MEAAPPSSSSAANININEEENEEEEEYELASSAVDQMPPGFRFHPTDLEIITHYLLNKVIDTRFRAVAIREIDLNKCEPWDLPRNYSALLFSIFLISSNIYIHVCVNFLLNSTS